jgi:hypothetical protein
MGNTQPVLDIKEFEKELIPIPNKRYILDDEHLIHLKKHIIENCRSSPLEDIKKIEETIKFILKNTKIVSFDDMLKSLLKSVIMFENEIKDMEFTLFIPFPASTHGIHEKSNYWISQIAYSFLTKKPQSILTRIDSSLFEKENQINIVTFDDAMYTGKQMRIYVVDILKSLTDISNKILNIWVVTPYSSIESREKEILSIVKDNREIIGTNIVTVKVITPKGNDIILHKVPHIDISDRYLMIFEHKLPDVVSTFDSLYSNLRWNFDFDTKKCIGYELFLKDNEGRSLILQCENDVCIPQIPVVPYKNRHGHKDITNVSSEYFKQFKKNTTDGKRNKQKSISKRKQKSKTKSHNSKKRY